MKFFLAVVFAAVILSIQAQQLKRQKMLFKSYQKECIKESGVDIKVLHKARVGEFEDDIKLKKHLFCMARKLGMMNDAGEFQKKKMVEKLAPLVKDKDITQKVIDECAVEKDTPEQSAFDAAQCYLKKISSYLENE